MGSDNRVGCYTHIKDASPLCVFETPFHALERFRSKNH